MKAHSAIAPRASAPDLDGLAAGMWQVYLADRDDVRARNALLLIYKPLAERGARAEARAGGDFYRRGTEHDEQDLEQIAMLALADLIAGYDRAKNDNFTKYAARWIRPRIKEVLRKQSWGGRHGWRVTRSIGRISGNLPLHGGDAKPHPDSLFDTIQSQDESPTMPAERAELIDVVMRKLPGQQDRTVFAMKFLDGRSSADIARYLGKNESTVSLILSRKVVPVVAAAFADCDGGAEAVATRLSDMTARKRRA
jgi:RNA polymerase sigma factor (sigma-70 family)